MNLKNIIKAKGSNSSNILWLLIIPLTPFISDDAMRKYLPAVVEAVYENILKIRVNGSYTEWLEDDSKDLRPKEESVEQEIKSAANQGTSPTQYCSSPGELSYRSNKSNRSNNNSPQRSPSSLDTQANL